MMQVLLLGRHEVQGVSDGLGQTDADVEGVHDWLAKVLVKGLFPQLAQVNTMEAVLVPATPPPTTLLCYPWLASPSYIKKEM